MSIRRATLRAASAGLAIASVFLLATCDLDKLTKPDVGGTPGNPLDSTELTLNLAGATTVGTTPTIPLLGTGTMSVTSSTIEMANVVTRYYTALPGVIAVDSLTGVMTGVALGTAKVTAKILAPELGAGITTSKNVRVRFKGIKIITPVAVDSLTGLGQTRTATAQGTNNNNAVIAGALVLDSVRMRTAGVIDTTSIRSNGTLLTAKKNGTAFLVAFFDGLRDSVAMKVRQVAKSITFPTTDFTAKAVNFNMTVPLTVKDVQDSVIPTPTITWSTKDTLKATVGAATGILRVKSTASDTVFAQVDTVKKGQRILVSQVVASLSKFQGDARSDTVAKNVTVVPTVTVLDSGSTAIVGASVQFKTGIGLNAVVVDTIPVTSDGVGRAKPTSWKLGDVAGTNNNTLIATSGTATTTFTVSGTNGPARKLGFSVSPTSASVNTSITPAIKVQVLDSLGNAVTTGAAAGATITLALGNNPGAATLAGTLSAVASAGVATFSNISLNAGGSGYTLQATSAGLTTAISNGFDIFGTATKLGFTTQPASTSQGATMATVRVAIQDAAGNTVSNSTANVTLSFSANPGSSTLGGTVTVPAVAGVATFTDLTINNAGTNYTFQATSTGLTTAVSSAFNVAAVGAAAKLAFSVQPTTVTAGAAITPGIKVQVLDANGGLVTTSAQQITLAIESSSPSGGVIGGTLPKNAVSGEATFSDITISKAGAGFKLLATAPGTSLTSTTSTAFTVNTGTATKLGFVQQPTHTVAGSTIAPSVTVEVQDASGNRVTTGSTFSVSLALSSCAGPVLSGGGAVATASGVATFSSLQLNAQGTGCVLTASATGLSNSPASNAFNSTASNGAARLSFTTEPSATVTAGSVLATAPVVTIQDASGASATASSSTSILLTILSGPQTSFSGGTTSGSTTTSASFANLKFNTAGSYRILASATGFDPDTSQIITVSPSTASQWGVTQQPTNTVAGVPFTPAFTAAVQDQFGNTIPGATNSLLINIFVSGGSSVQFSAGPGLTNSGFNSTAVAVNGVATFTGLAPKGAGTLQMCTQSTGALNGFCTSTFTVATAPVAKLGFVVQPPGTATTGTAMTAAIQVAGQDSVGNTVTDFGNAITVAMTGGSASATLGGTKTVAPTLGVATFSNLTIDIASQSYQLSASASGVTTANSNLFNAEPGYLFNCCPGFEDMAILGTTIYFTGSNALKSVPVAGTTVTTIAGSTNARAITTDGTNIYWAERGTNNNGDAFIKKLTVSTGIVSTLTVAQTFLTDWNEMRLATDGVNVYFVARNLASSGYALKSVPVGAASAAPTEVFTANSFNPIFFMLKGGLIYFYEASTTAVRRMTSAGATITALSTTSITAKFFTLSGTTLIFNDGVTLKSIASATTAGSAVTPTTLATAPGNVYELASDGTNVYVNGDGTLRRYPVANFATFTDLVVTSPTVSQQYAPFMFDATSLYFYSNFGRLAKVPK